MNFNILLVTALSLSFVLSACDKSTSHRTKPGRKAGVIAGQNQKTQDPKKPNGTNADGAETETQTDAANANKPSDPKPTGTPSNNLLSREGSIQGEGDLVANEPNGSRGSTGTTAQNATVNKQDSSRGAPTQNTADKAQTKTAGESDQTIKDLQIVLSQLNNIYLNAWFTITKDKFSRPRNFFENIATKMQNLGPIITLHQGEATPSTIRDRCDTSRLVQVIANDRRALMLFDCTTQQYANILVYRVQGTQWQIASTPQALELILPNQLGYLSTISYKPMCTITVSGEHESLRVTNAHCKDWGQELSASRAKDRKTILFSSIKYDQEGSYILETEAQYIDYDGANQVCRSDLLKRKAPKPTEVVYVDDEGDGQCHAAPPLENTHPAAAAEKANARGKVVENPRKPKKTVEANPTEETEEVVNVEEGQQNDLDPDAKASPLEPTEKSEKTEALPEDPTDDYGAIQAQPVAPTQQAPAMPNNEDLQQMDFSSLSTTEGVAQ